jgi:hypothetical protein
VRKQRYEKPLPKSGQNREAMAILQAAMRFGGRP